MSGAHSAASTSPTAARAERDRDLEPRGVEAYVAEFIGTLILVAFVGFVVVQNSRDGLGVTDFAVIGLVHVFVLGMLIHTLGGASGAHFNPAVTIALTAIRKISPADAIVYIILQLAGAVAGALLVKLVLNDEGAAVGYGQTTLGDQIDGDPLPGFLVELIGTFVLMWAIMGVAVNPQGARDWAGFAIGGTLGFAVMCLAPLTGAGFNPARAAGPSLVGDNSEAVGDFVVAYVLGPIVGALLAAALYSAVIINAQHRAGRRPVDTLSGAAESRRDEGDDVERVVDRLD
jgi:glycerol uptake facilitator protein